MKIKKEKVLPRVEWRYRKDASKHSLKAKFLVYVCENYYPKKQKGKVFTKQVYDTWMEIE